MAKQPLTCLFRENAATPEGKYLVQRRDGTVPPWPSFVLGAPDPVAAKSLRQYCAEVCLLVVCEPEQAAKLGFTADFARRLYAWVQRYDDYRSEHGESDPGMGPHRIDDPAIVAKMRQGLSA